MKTRFLAAVLAAFCFQATGRADGCKWAPNGVTVPEREQWAFVEWADGVETLHVATRTDPTTGGSLWVVPVRGKAGAVRAEPVDTLPAVVYYESLRSRAERQLRYAVTLTGVLNSGGVFCPVIAFGGCGGLASGRAIEESRVEYLGMVVTVVSAESRSALEAYLDEQGVSRTANLSSLDPYFGTSDHAFVCGWVAKRNEPVTATGMKITFPSPTLWFPLKPTRAYTNAVETVVYTRGFVKPASGCKLPGLSCQYVFGETKELGVRDTFKPIDSPGGFYRPAQPLERLTRVTLTTDPQQWDRDLELVPGTTLAGSMALAVTGWAGFFGPLWSALLGAVLGLCITACTVTKWERKRVDWLAGALTGASIVLTIWASVIVFFIWRRRRFAHRPANPYRWVIFPVLALIHFGIVAGVCEMLIRWIKTSA